MAAEAEPADRAEPTATAAGSARPAPNGKPNAGRGRLAGRRVLVVGGGQNDYGLADPPVGNGRAITVLAAREGADVAVADIDVASAERTAELARAEGAEAVVLQGDASDEEAVAAMFAECASRLGGVDGVVANVGIGAGVWLRHTTVEEWDRVMAVNVRSQFLACRRALATVSRGAVVLIGSVAAREVMPIPSYAVSKAALEALCRQAAAEGAPDVRVNLIEPGLIDTPLGRFASSLNPHRAEVGIPAGRQGSSAEVAQAAVFLLSEESSYVTGQCLVVDGGLTVAPRR